MPMATIHKVGSGELYHIHFLDQHGTDPGYGQGRPGMEHPGNRPPGGGNYPSQGLPGHEGGTDPGYGQGHPRPGIPSNELPETPPPQLAPGWTLVLVRGPQGRWQYAAMAPGSPPPRPLPPGEIEHPGNRPPGSGGPNLPSQGLPGQGGQPGGIPHPGGGPMPPQVGGGPMPTPPPTAGTPLPPTAQPR